ncbi:MAG: hypothetical protein ACOYNS_08425 [Bacteroidota bacterium]
MKLFRLFLFVMFSIALLYTITVASRYGMNIFPIFFGDIMSVIWTGQFHLDFVCYLMLSGIWVAWRHRYSPFGIVMGAFCTIGGILVFAPYLFAVGIMGNGSVKELMLGKHDLNE